jgi:hypothetical protein
MFPFIMLSQTTISEVEQVRFVKPVGNTIRQSDLRAHCKHIDKIQS